MGLLTRIHYHRGGCMELMEKVERIMGNPPHILEWQIVVWLYWSFRKFFFKISLSVVWSSMPLGHGRLSWNWTIMTPMEESYSCLWSFYWVSFLAKPFGRGLVMDDYHGRTKLNLDCINTYSLQWIGIANEYSWWCMKIVNELMASNRTDRYLKNKKTRTK